MILLVQNDTEYEIDLRAMLGAFFLAEKIKSAKPEEVAQFDRQRFSDFTLMLTAIYEDKNTSLKLEEDGHVLYSAYIYGRIEKDIVISLSLLYIGFCLNIPS